MDDSIVIPDRKRLPRRARQFFSFVSSLMVAALPSMTIADDSPGPRLLPPVTNSWQSELSAIRGLPGNVVFPESSRFYHDTPTGYPNVQLEHVPEPAAASTFGDRLFQLTGLLEPAADSEAASKPADGAEASADPDGKKPTYGQKPVSNSLQFLRQQSVLLDPGAMQFDTGFVYLNFDNDFPVGVQGSSPPNLSGVVEGHIRRRLMFTPLGLRLGLTRNVQAFASMALGFSNTQISTFGTNDTFNSGGIGDLTAGLNMHLLESQGDCPDVIATLGFTAPTGKYGAPLFGLSPGSNLGQGFWALTSQLLFINRYDPIIVFYGGGYNHLFEREFDGVLFSAGEQVSYQFGLGFSVNDRVTLSTAFQGFYITNTFLDHVSIRGSNIEPLSLRFAATIARRDRILEPFALIGMTDYAPSASLGITVTFY